MMVEIRYKKAALKGSKARIRDYLVSKLGTVVSSRELQQAANGASEWARRLRELRDEEGYQIKSHKDDQNLKPGEYRLDTLELAPASKRTIDNKLRAQVLADAGGVCQWCGAVAGRPHPEHPNKLTHLQVSHIVDKAKGGSDSPSNLMALCSFCNEGASIETREPPRDVQLFALVRRAPRDVQRAVYERLNRLFGDPK